MAHIDHPPPSRREVVMRLRPGDILTHCFKPFPNTLLRSDGEIWEEVRLARERGVIFDLGHGGMSFGFHTAAGMLAKGFMPDVLSTDLHVLSVDGPAFDLLTTVSKFHALGVDLPTLIRATTCSPAAAIHRPELGTLRPGSPGDATLIALEQGKFTYHDCLGMPLESDTRLVARGAVRRGAWCDR